MTTRSPRDDAFTMLRNKLRLFRQFFASLRKRGMWRTLKMSIFEVYHEHRLGAETSFIIPHEQLDGQADALSHAVDYFPSSYLVLSEAFSQVGDDCRNAVLVDYGCGMGRALMFASTLPIKRMVGVEVSPSLCAAARKNLERLYRKMGRVDPNWAIVNADARVFAVPDDANLFYLFNPFDAAILGQVIDNIVKSVRSVPRKCTVIYANPVHETEFSARGFRKVAAPSSDFSVFMAAELA
jgi:predicted RNA methylase